MVYFQLIETWFAKFMSVSSIFVNIWTCLGSAGDFQCSYLEMWHFKLSALDVRLIEDGLLFGMRNEHSFNHFVHEWFNHVNRLNIFQLICVFLWQRYTCIDWLIDTSIHLICKNSRFCRLNICTEIQYLFIF